MKSRLNILIKIISVVVIWLGLFYFAGLSNDINNGAERIFKIIKGEAEPDTNIVIIHVSKDDIDKIGPWPIKRSYYALLINNLTKQRVKKIGIEIFLSSRLVTQSIYEDLLKNEILKSGKVVLSSVAGAINKTDAVFITDSLSFPSTKLLSNKIETGHINYIEDNGIKIPVKIVNQSIPEDAFALKISDVDLNQNYILANFICSWKKFKNYSLTEYFNLLQTNPQILYFLKDKIVIIGISDTEIAKTFTSAFDDELPGTALHAFVIDNILNTRFLRDSNYQISIFIIIALILILIFISERNSQSLLISIAALILFIIISFSIYWMILTLGPILFGSSIALSSYLVGLTRFADDYTPGVSTVALSIVPYIMSMLAFFILYIVVPNIKVRSHHAFYGALLATLLFELCKRGFAFYITHFPSYDTIYGAMALVPILFVWVYLCWLVVLLGAELTALLQQIAADGLQPDADDPDQISPQE
ncbi:MAG: YihY family inner membrane protein [Nitrososphaeraceae archaeon]|nr:YihY family inner membrane protein [Nitrososphaeraceae archaeon]